MMTKTATEQKEQPDSMKLAVERLEDLRGYCRTYKSQWGKDDEVRYALNLIEDSLTETLTDLCG